MLKEHIDSFYLAKKPFQRKSLYVTDVAACPRAVFYDFKGFPRAPVDPRSSRVMHNGDFVHARLAEVLQKVGVLKEEDVEVSLPDNDLVRGRADAIIEVNGDKVVVDFKSMNGFQFKALSSPSPDHVKQVQLYLHFLNLKKGLLVYECKNTQELKEFEVFYDEHVVNESLAFFYSLQSQINQDVLPDVPLGIEKWKCDRCSFLADCKKVGNPFYPNEKIKV
ncbi:MAG: CRISPR-associated protein Cas4 [Nanoarchaeota archaeon]|nr:CRISPR-associated protein Cas4 [Nanoarchaeota archaeon]